MKQLSRFFAAIAVFTIFVATSFAQDTPQPPKVVFDSAAWLLLNNDPVLKQEVWLKKSEIFCDGANCAPVGMVRFTDGPKIINGKQVQRIFSESIVDCDRQMLFPVRDVYTSDDNTVIFARRQPPTIGALPTTQEGTIAYATYQLICKGITVKVPKE